MRLTVSWINDGTLDNHADASVELQENDLRDLFAAFALAGVMANKDAGDVNPRWAAAKSYDLADAMLAQRNEKRK